MKSRIFNPLSIICILQLILLAYFFTKDSESELAASIILKLNANKSKTETKEELIYLYEKVCKITGVSKNSQRYQNIYGTFLGPIRHNPLNFLEVGLGCTMPYGPGKSLAAWKVYLTHPDTKISFLEYDRKCAEKFLPPKVHNMFIGDQADFDLLNHVGKEGGPYDFIVEDGGHQRTQMVNSFLGLWPYVKPNGGIYVMEDLHLAFYKEFYNSEYTPFDMTEEFILILLEAHLKGDFMVPTNRTFNKKYEEIAKSILSINCFFHACVFVKA